MYVINDVICFVSNVNINFIHSLRAVHRNCRAACDCEPSKLYSRPTETAGTWACMYRPSDKIVLKISRPTTYLMTPLKQDTVTPRT